MQLRTHIEFGPSARQGMPRVLLLLWFWVTAGLVGSIWPAGAAQTKEQSVVVGGVNLVAVQTRIQELEKAEQTDAVKSDLTALRQTAQFVEQTAASEKAYKLFVSQAENAPAVLQELDKEIAAPLVEPDMSSLAGKPLDKLIPQLDAARTQLDIERQIRASVDDDIAHRNDRRQKIPSELAQLRERLAEIKAHAPSPREVETSDTSLVTRWLREAERKFIEVRLKELDQELRSYDARRDLLRMRKQLAEKRALQAERLFTALESVVSAQRARQAEDARRSAEDQRRKAADAHPAVREVAEQNESFATALSEVSERSTALAADKQRVDELLQRLRKAFNSAQEKVEQVGLTDAVGIHLRNQKLQLPDARIHRRNLDARADDMNQVQLRRLELEDVLVDLVDVGAEAQRRLSKYSFDSVQDRNEVEGAVTSLLTKQKDDYAPALVKALDIYFDEILVPIHDSERQLLETLEQYREFIDERVLWVQSTHALNLDDLVSLWNALHWLVVNAAWVELGHALLQDLVHSAFPWVICVVLVSTLVSQRKKLRQAIHDTGDRAKRKFKARLLDAFAATLFSVLAMLPVPLMLVFLSWRVGIVADSAVAVAVADALQRLSVWCVMPLFLQQAARVNGVGESHFRWSEHALKLIRRQMRWYIPLGMLAFFLAALTFQQPLGALRDSFGRLTFLVLMGMTLVLTYRFFHPSTGLLKNYLAQNSGGWLDKLRYLWFSLLLAIPFGMIIAVMVGYVYTAVYIQQHFFLTAALVFVGIFIREYLLRWLELEQRRMAIEQARRRFAAMTKAREEAAAAAGEGSPGEVSIPESEINVAAVSAQSQKMVGFATWIAVVAGAMFIWKDVLPALSFLGEVTVWTQMVAVVSSATGETIQQVVPVTLGHLLLAVLVLIVAILVSQNIPGLLEVAVLQHLPITPGARYAVTTVARYALFIIGILLAFNTIGIGWSKVQWLAAAITVGLGFGLQEIFANFVSGLIILFERPVRVGDAVTVGDVSGKVSRIRMRATTITDWNRKELIIPNKTFVTGQVINWSLSDTILRVPIKVGVAYGSDTEKVTRLLVETARKHPTVLVDPPPTAYFVAFGDSALDFDLRVFVPNPDEMFNVRHDLLIAIDKAFREAGIEIAFPQRDLHLRSVDPLVWDKLRPGGAV